MKLKIFSDKSYIPSGSSYISLLYPFWGKPSQYSDNFWNIGYKNYFEKAHELFDISSLESADLAIIPCDWEPVFGRETQNSLLQFVEKVNLAGKPILSFFDGDCSHHELPIKNDLVLRHSLYSYTRKACDFALPNFITDLVKEDLNNQLPIRYKQSKPTVGFRGLAAPKSLKTYLKLFLHKVRKLSNDTTKIPPYNIGHAIRFEALGFLSKSKNIQTNFFINNASFFHQPDSKTQSKLRAEFIQNMVDSDYIFCCRGSGNYSIRFVEALCCGRIPVFLDTDCALPYDFKIDWKKYCIWVNESELPFIADKIAEFHENISPQDFVDLQYECRELWKQYLSCEGFFSNFYLHLSQINKQRELIT